MTALTGARGITQKGADFIGPVSLKANAVIYHGALVSRATGGYAVAASATATDTVLGVADLSTWNDLEAVNGQKTTLVNTASTVVDNTGGADGARQCMVRTGVFAFNNKGGDALAVTEIGTSVYVEDDNTVRKTSTGSTIAGTLMGFDARTGLPLVMVGNRYGEAV